MKKLTDNDKTNISNAVKEAEKSTSGEIVPVFLNRSDFYPAAHFRSAIAFSLAFAVALYYSPYEIEDPLWLLWVQIPGLIIGYLLPYLSCFKRFFSTKGEINEEVRQRAVEIFFNQNLHSTRDRTGILIMVSILERRVEILADTGINEKVEQYIWDEILNKLIEKIKNKDAANGLCEAIKSSGEILNKHFPIKSDDTNELSNEVVTD